MTPSQYSQPCYDATWTLAYALNETLSSKSNLTTVEPWYVDIIGTYRKCPDYRFQHVSIALGRVSTIIIAPMVRHCKKLFVFWDASYPHCKNEIAILTQKKFVIRGSLSEQTLIFWLNKLNTVLILCYDNKFFTQYCVISAQKIFVIWDSLPEQTYCVEIAISFLQYTRFTPSVKALAYGPRKISPTSGVINQGIP